MTETTVVIADDHAVVRKGLRLLVDAEPGLRVVAEAGTAHDALRMARAHRAGVLILDLNMPGGSRLEAIRQAATNSEIAGELHLSVRTVESHRAHIQQKTRRSTRAELVRYALEHGLVEL
jgi:two-component system, NarL family, response regulator NreC